MMRTEYLLTSLAMSMLLTLAVELAAVCVIEVYKRSCRTHLQLSGAASPSERLQKHQLRKSISCVILVNTLTNPAVVLLHFLNIWYLGMPGLPFDIGLEIIAIAVEAGCYYLFDSGRLHPVIFSIAANVLSYSIGLLMQL